MLASVVKGGSVSSEALLSRQAVCYISVSAGIDRILEYHYIDYVTISAVTISEVDYVTIMQTTHGT